MKLLFLYGMVLISPCLYPAENNNLIPYINFDISMGKGSQDYAHCMQAEKKCGYTLSTYPKKAIELFNFFKELYQHNIHKILSTDQPRIPHIIHMVWIGGEFPEIYHDFRKSWFEHHPAWTHIFWTDNPANYKFGNLVSNVNTLKEDLLNGMYAGQAIVIDTHNLKLHNQTFYDQVSNLGEKSDILKYELVYMFGGVYIDIDFECKKPLDILHQSFDFYVGIQPLNESLALGAALFAGVPGNSILKTTIETIKNDRSKKGLIERTGPIHFTRSFWHAAQHIKEIVIAFPATYFYPVRLDQKNLSQEQKESLIKPESFAVHHWAGSWQ